MRITSWNLLHGLPIPPDEDANPEALLSAALSQLATDVIGLQEVDYFLERSGSHNQTGNVASIVGAKDWAFAPSLMGSPDEDWRNPNKNDAIPIPYDPGATSLLFVMSLSSLSVGLRQSSSGDPMSDGAKAQSFAPTIDATLPV